MTHPTDAAIVTAGPTRNAHTLHVDQVTVTYGTLVALHQATLTARPGQFLAVTGPSGAGKSSLLWALAGALVPASGRVTYGDQPVGGREAAARAGIVIIPQGNGLATTLTATENALVPLLVTGTPPGEATRRVQAALASVGLEDSGNHLIEELSGGQQQRVAVARALASTAHVILADEPTSDLDSITRERIITLLRSEAEGGAIVIMSTHDPDAAAETDAEIALDEGHLTWARPLTT